jgi:hypothetical protein
MAHAYHFVYDSEFYMQLRFIEQKYHSVIRRAIEDNLLFEPDKQGLNRKPLSRTGIQGSRWELRCGDNNEFRIFYSIYSKDNEVHILAVGIKTREKLFIGGKEVEL